MLDIDTLNIIALEDKQQQKEERAIKNSILDITNSEKKQKLWSENFPHTEQNDDYLLGNIF